VSRHTATRADAVNEPGTIARGAHLLAEYLAHDFGSARNGGHDLIPVDQFSRGRLVVPGQQRDRLNRHAMGPTAATRT